MLYKEIRPSSVKLQATKTYGDSAIIHKAHGFVYTIVYKLLPSHTRPIRPGKGELHDSWLGHIAPQQQRARLHSEASK